jgi:hypothetical protein
MTTDKAPDVADIAPIFLGEAVSSGIPLKENQANPGGRPR